MNEVAIQPEIAAVADSYVAMDFDLDKTAKALNMDKRAVLAIIDSKEASAYISRIYFNTGYLNKSKFFSVMEKLIDKKLEEMEESEMGSSADILELMQAMHKMKMDELKLELKRAEIEQASKAKPGVAIQVNNNGVDPEAISNWAKVLTKITKRGQ